MRNKAGCYRKNLSGETAYESFLPTMLRSAPLVEMDEPLREGLRTARADLAALEAVLELVPDSEAFVDMLACKEALASCQIEGTRASLEDVLGDGVQDGANPETGDVFSLLAALRYALEFMKELPLSMRLIKRTHAVLLRGGLSNAPGETRRSQNWIGGPGSSLRSASYVPPSVQDLPALLTDLEFYINEEPDIDPLISAALMHYQFETIHPFLDGNGRLGRLLVTLYLMDQGLLSKPALTISSFLNENRSEYYDRLSQVRLAGDYEQWVGFFLDAVSDGAKDAARSLNRLRLLRERNQERVLGAGAPAWEIRVLRYLENSSSRRRAPDLGGAGDTLPDCQQRGKASRAYRRSPGDNRAPE